jgi:hypothetical protein
VRFGEDDEDKPRKPERAYNLQKSCKHCGIERRKPSLGARAYPDGIPVRGNNDNVSIKAIDSKQKVFKGTHHTHQTSDCSTPQPAVHSTIFQ